MVSKVYSVSSSSLSLSVSSLLMVDSSSGELFESRGTERKASRMSTGATERLTWAMAEMVCSAAWMSTGGVHGMEDASSQKFNALVLVSSFVFSSPSETTMEAESSSSSASEGVKVSQNESGMGLVSSGWQKTLWSERLAMLTMAVHAPTSKFSGLSVWALTELEAYLGWELPDGLSRCSTVVWERFQ